MMLHRKGLSFWTGFVSFSLALLLASSGCEERLKPSVLSDLKDRELPSHESWNSTITFSDSGKIKAVLRVGHLEKFEERQSTTLDGGLQVDFFDDDGHHTSVLTAVKGSVDDRTHDLVAVVNVVVVSDSGTTLRTELLHWKNSTRRVHSDEFVKIT